MALRSPPPSPPPMGSHRRMEAPARITREPVAGRRVSTRTRSNISTPVSRIQPLAPGETLQPEINPSDQRSARRTELINVAPETSCLQNPRGLLTPRRFNDHDYRWNESRSVCYKWRRHHPVGSVTPTPAVFRFTLVRTSSVGGLWLGSVIRGVHNARSYQLRSPLHAGSFQPPIFPVMRPAE